MLANRLALVTGAASGVGEATVGLFAKEGATIIGVDVNENVRKVVCELEEPCDSVAQHKAYVCDVSNSTQVNELFERIKQDYPVHKVPTIIVNCAGITQKIPFLEFSEEEYDRTMNINLKGTFLINQTALKELVDNYDNSLYGEADTYASIINIASILARTSPVKRVPYCASKAGVDALTRGIANEFGVYKIRCNSLCPGLVLTPMALKEEYEVDIATSIQTVPLRRGGQAIDIAKVCLFLASDLSSFVTGSSIVADGGALV